ncbi:unnamed protein product, partial [Ectocarpus sp. 12 AP-2014]
CSSWNFAKTSAISSSSGPSDPTGKPRPALPLPSPQNPAASAPGNERKINSSSATTAVAGNQVVARLYTAVVRFLCLRRILVMVDGNTAASWPSSLLASMLGWHKTHTTAGTDR